MKYAAYIERNSGRKYIKILAKGEKIYQDENPVFYNELRKKLKAAIARKQKNELFESFGLTKVKGTISGKTYWE